MDAMKREVQSLQKLKVYTTVPRRPGMKVIGTKWTYVVKPAEKAQGDPTYKARFVAKGYQQVFGQNYFDTWAPTVGIDAIRLLAALAASARQEIHHFDVRTAFLNATLTEKNIYVEPPKGFFEQDTVLHLHRALYGLKQAGREWYETLTDTLIASGFSKSTCEPCLYFRHDKDSLTIIVTHVDDLLTTGTPVCITSLTQSLKRKFAIKVNGPVTFAMGIKFERVGYDYILSQEGYTSQLLTHFGFSSCKSTPIPMSTTPIKNLKRTSLEQFPLNAIVGSLLWLAKTTRPDIAFPTAILAQQVHDPSPTAYASAGRVLRYLKGTSHYGIRMKSQSYSSPLELFTDADWASDASRKSHTGVLVFLGESPIAWMSKKQPTISLSSSEAEIIAACQATTLCKWFMNLMTELKLPLQRPITIYEDNSAAIFLSNTSVHGKRLKHIDIKWRYINDEVKAGNVKLIKIPTQLNLADLLTKPLSIHKFRELSTKLITTSSTPSSDP